MVDQRQAPVELAPLTTRRLGGCPPRAVRTALPVPVKRAVNALDASGV